MMGKILNGAVQAGAWVCLDEFNRIDIEVLSVVAQQMSTLRHARLRGLTDVWFEGKHIPLREHHVIITMNPGYVGRTELPDNLKVCFRPVAMMVPDYSLIAEILLFAEGFQTAKPLSKKVTKLYKLCSEQLSQQPHYDFGMRAVKAVLLMAGAQKRVQTTQSSLSESLALVASMRDANIPKLLDNDAFLFEGILRDLFPDELSDIGGLPQASTSQTLASLNEEIDRQTAQQGLTSTVRWKQKMLQLFETLEVRVGVVQIGSSGSGKSSGAKILRDALTALREARNHPDKRFQRVIAHVLNPKAITINELYGFFHPMTREWTDGLASKVLRQCITEKSEFQSSRAASMTGGGPQVASATAGAEGPSYWITFDGPIDVLWIESMNTVLDDNMTLCLANGERIKLLPKIQLLFEVASLASASPATISRLGVVYYHPSYLGWRAYVERWASALTLPTNHSVDVTSATVKDAAGIHKATHSSVRLCARLKTRLFRYFDLFVEPGLEFLRGPDRLAMLGSELAVVSSTCAIFETLLLRRATPEIMSILSASVPQQLMSGGASTAAATATLEAQQNRCFDIAFLFSYVWSFGGHLQIDRWKDAFQDLVFSIFEANEQFFSRDLLTVSGKVATRTSQVNSSFFDFFVDFQYQSFVPWELLLPDASASASATIPPPLDFKPERPLFEVLVPTADMMKHTYLLQLMALDGASPVLLTGATGAGKTVIVQHVLRSKHRLRSLLNGTNLTPTREIQPVHINFSAQTTSWMTQMMIESKLVKKRKTLLGAAMGSQIVVFVDDINMPRAEGHGAQPPIELLRHLLEYRGMYDREKFFWKDVCDTVVIAVGGLPGGGRQPLCPRFLRQFAAIWCMPSSDEAAMRTIFSSIMSAFTAGSGAISKAAKDALLQSVDAAVSVYSAASKNLLPTPSKSHYLFNLRDVTKIMQGIVIGVRWHRPENLTPELVAKLWAHECIRVFRDRLIADKEKKWISEQLVTLANRSFGIPWALEHVYEAERTGRRTSIGGTANTKYNPIVFSALPPLGESPTEENSSLQCYSEVTDFDAFEERLDAAQSHFNSSHPSTRMELVFFKDAMIHIAAVARILSQPRGHALLLGMAGSGKRSLARMTAHVMGYHCHELEVTKSFSISDFRETLKSLMLVTVLGTSDSRRRSVAPSRLKPTVLLLSEAQLVSEQFLEDINTLLNGGEIPKLFSLEEYEKMLSAVRSHLTAAHLAGSPLHEVRDFSRAECEAHFVGQVQQRMHIVICHSPTSDAFRARIRQFPSLTNCMTIDFFDVWPSYALQYVADRFLTETKHALSAATRNMLGLLCMEIHQSAVKQCAAFLAQQNRHVYFTPKHYLDLVLLFIHIYDGKQRQLDDNLTRLSVGVIKLEETNALVATLREELVALQPILQTKTVEAEQLLQQVGIDQAEARVVAQRVAQDEAIVKQQQREVAVCQADAQKDLDQALPALHAAVTALDGLDKKDITEVRAFVKPPQAVQMVMEAVCVMLGEKPDWDTSKRLLSRSTFMADLKEYDKDNINPSILKRIRKYIDNPEFAVEEVKKVSRAAMSLCMWVHAIDTYARVYKEVAPKRQRLAEMNAVLATANTRLEEKQQELAQVVANVNALKDQCDRTLAEKERLVQESDLTQARLQRAERLTAGLKEERVRWKLSIEDLRVQGRSSLGDSFLAAAAISYLGPFDAKHRTMLMRRWVTFAEKLVDVSASFTLVDVYGDAMELREWELVGLPSDTLSQENAIYVMRGNPQRWPLLIDPQDQASQWIKRLETVNRLMSVKAYDRNIVATVEEALQNGRPLLIEGVGEQALEASLEPLLSKSFVKTSGDGAMTVKLGDRAVVVNPDKFRLYLATQMSNPHFAPDVFIRLSVINFSVNADGLVSQLLSDVVRRERVEIEERKHNLMLSIAQDQKMLQQLEVRILNLLSESKGNILDDVELIHALESAKQTSRVVTQRLQESQVTKHQLLSVRNQYQSVATRGALLFFVIADLAHVDAMYQYSLEYFRRLFITSVEEAPACASLDARLDSLKSHLTFVVYRNISRGLFTCHRLLFSALVTLRVLIMEGEINFLDVEMIDPSYVTATTATTRFTISSASPSHSGASAAKTAADVDPIEALLGLAAQSETMNKVLECYRGEPSAWMTWMTGDDPFSTPLPGDLDSVLTRFERLVLVRWMRDDAWTLALRHFVAQVLGSRFVDHDQVDARKAMSDLFIDMSHLTPCIFILSSGADPISMLTQFASDCHPDVYPERYHSISLGQGQGPIAEGLLQSSAEQGHWLVLQNIHLAKSWIPRFQELLTNLGTDVRRADVHTNFRLFITTFPVDYFPVSVLQNSVKVTNEPPKGIKANLQRSMHLLTGVNADAEKTDTGTEKLCGVERQLVFGLSFFHAVLQERPKFGSLGWNLKYDFNDADFLSVVTLQRQLLLDAQQRYKSATPSHQQLDSEGEELHDDDTAADSFSMLHVIPWDALHYLTGEIYYGGRVTDEFDRRCLMANLRRFCSLTTLSAGATEPVIRANSHALSKIAASLFARSDGSFTAPQFETDLAMTAFVNALPDSMDAPFVFGMHPNANAFYLKNETRRLLGLVLQLQSREEMRSSGEEVTDNDDDVEEEQEGAGDRKPKGATRRRSLLRQPTSNTMDAAEKPSPEAIVLQVSTELRQKLPRPRAMAAKEANGSGSHVGSLESVFRGSSARNRQV
ncbi:hypothetical protein PINS_up015068 [Pythium insidiosum]|nr:hypothetical protein PINS_up015068 [Pythium insidiosum]